VDGCEKRCAQIGTKKYSGKPFATIVVTQVLKKHPKLNLKSRDELSVSEFELAEKVAEEIARTVDDALNMGKSQIRSEGI